MYKRQYCSINYSLATTGLLVVRLNGQTVHALPAVRVCDASVAGQMQTLCYTLVMKSCKMKSCKGLGTQATETHT